jgi:hypothetical protein
MRFFFKKGFYAFYNEIIFIYFKIISLRYCKNIYIFDIDNTLADTWISFHNYDEGKQHFERLNTLAIFINMRKTLDDVSSNKENTIIFLTARNFLDYNVTFKWLRNNSIGVNFGNLFLVPNASSKLKFIRYLIKGNYNITYLDDLSYNHENGEIQYYQSLINEIDLLPICYINYFKIQQINAGIDKL